MNLLFLIGNGFDINLGMETRYSDFFNYYRTKPSPSILIQKLKTAIDKNHENWSDLELELGKYTKNLSSSKEFFEIFDDIEDRLAEYLEVIENNFDINQFDNKKLYNYLVYPENSLPPADRNKLKAFREKWKSSQWNINIVTFNYTQTIEKLTNYAGKKIELKEYIKRNHSVLLHKIEHVHGFINERMVMGVNDISQISNVSFHENQDVLESLVKNDCNLAQKHTIEAWCKNQILNAHIICVFGSSIGDTDNNWWELIGEQLKRDCRLIIFEKGEQIPSRRPQIGRIAERKKKQYFFGKTQLNEQEVKTADEKFFLTVNSEMFKL